MGPAYQVNFVLAIEFLNNVAAEKEACTSGGDAPAGCVIRVRPHEIAHGSVVGNLLLSINRSNLIKSVDRRTQSTMDAEYFVINDCRKSQVVKNVSAIPPNVDTAKLSEALIIEAIDLSDLTTLVVYSDQGDSLWVPDFQGNKEQEGFD